MGIDYIPCLIISHSHDDHIGGAVSILGEYQDRSRKICFVQDDEFLKSSFWLRISELLKAGILTRDRLVRLEATAKPQLVWSAASARLRTFSPLAAETVLAQADGEQNPTSAVLFLDVGSHRIIFGADSEVSQWREIIGNLVDDRSAIFWRCRIMRVQPTAPKLSYAGSWTRQLPPPSQSCPLEPATPTDIPGLTWFGLCRPAASESYALRLRENAVTTLRFCGPVFCSRFLILVVHHPRKI